MGMGTGMDERAEEEEEEEDEEEEEARTAWPWLSEAAIANGWEVGIGRPRCGSFEGSSAYEMG